MKRTRNNGISVAISLVLVAVVALVACGGGFDAPSKVNSVRILGVRVDAPYAKPGQTVSLDLLAVDGRLDQTRPMQIAWLPFVCVNPPQDLYYACFLPLSNGQGGAAKQSPVVIYDPNTVDGGSGGTPLTGAGGGSVSAGDIIGRIPPGTDLTPFLPKGPRFAFKMPDNIIDSHAPVEGARERYGIAFVFHIACAGKIVLAPTDSSKGPQQVPIACVGPDGAPLPATEYVFGFSRVYGYDTKVNHNPELTKVTFQGADVDVSKGVTTPKCTTRKRDECPKVKFDAVVPESSWEDNPGDVDENGGVLKEQVWVAYFATQGDFVGDARLLYDTRGGKITDSAIEYQAPFNATRGTIYAVVHDSRGGTSWTQFPIQITEQ
jgi:hypothetical protein